MCNKNSNLHLKCPARCVTSGQNSIKLSKKIHNHEPIYGYPVNAYNQINICASADEQHHTNH